MLLMDLNIVPYGAAGFICRVHTGSVLILTLVNHILTAEVGRRVLG